MIRYFAGLVDADGEASAATHPGYRRQPVTFGATVDAAGNASNETLIEWVAEGVWPLVRDVVLCDGEDGPWLTRSPLLILPTRLRAGERLQIQPGGLAIGAALLAAYEQARAKAED